MESTLTYMQINIPPHAEDWLRRRAAESGCASIEQYVLSIVLPQQDAVESKNGRTFFEAATEAGLIGGGSDYAEDLSSNPDHLQGFGR